MPKKVVDAISDGRFLRFVMNGTKGRGKPNKGGYKLIDSLGERIQVPLMYGKSPVDTYSGWLPINVTPTDGVTSAFFQTRQVASSIVITGFEQEQNKGENAILPLLETKINQSVITTKDFVNQICLSGNAINGNSLVAYASAGNGSAGPDPISVLVSKTPTTGTVGSIDTSTNTWFANQFDESAAASFAALDSELDNLYTSCGIAPGGDSEPDFHLVDPQTFNIYRAALRTFAKIELTNYKDADLPFENLLFRGGTVFYDKFVPDNYTGTTPNLGGASATRAQGTWFMFNSEFMDLYASKANNFKPGKFIEALDQDGIASKVLWYGGLTVSNRSKHGLLNKISLSLTS
jgi:hypothetical protein